MISKEKIELLDKIGGGLSNATIADYAKKLNRRQARRSKFWSTVWFLFLMRLVPMKHRQRVYRWLTQGY